MIPRSAAMRISVAAFVSISGICCGLFIVHRHFYPHGIRAGMLPTFMAAMYAYAQDHNGWYPKDGNSPLESLQKLYPMYESEGLAGLSGSESRTLRLLKNDKPLDATVSSWVYWPGFRSDDDPGLAIIWEREPGLFVTGARGSGYAVGFAGGGCVNIRADQWADFVRDQEERRKKVLASRMLSTNSAVMPSDKITPVDK